MAEKQPETHAYDPSAWRADGSTNLVACGAVIGHSTAEKLSDAVTTGFSRITCDTCLALARKGAVKFTGQMHFEGT